MKKSHPYDLTGAKLVNKAHIVGLSSCSSATTPPPLLLPFCCCKGPVAEDYPGLGSPRKPSQNSAGKLKKKKATSPHILLQQLQTPPRHAEERGTCPNNHSWSRCEGCRSEKGQRADQSQVTAEPRRKYRPQVPGPITRGVHRPLANTGRGELLG